MKLSTLQENLKQGLFVVGHIAGKNINLPILNNIKIEAKQDGLRLLTTNLEIGIVSYIRGKIDVEGEITVDSKLITDYVNLLPNKKINIEKKGDNLVFVCENYKTKIKGQSAEEFPLIPEVEKDNKYKTKIKDFKKALSQIIFAVSTNESRVELSGVFFQFNGDKLTLAATDSYRLAEKEIFIENNNKEKEVEKSIIIPSRTLQELIRILSGIKNEEDGFIDFYLTENQIMFSVDSVDLVSRLIEGQYPDYKQIIPNNKKTTVIINKNELTRAVKTSSLFSKSDVNDINFDFPREKNKILITSTSGNTGENIVELDANVNGEDNSVIINYRYLLDGLNNISDENVKIEIIDNKTPCVLKPEKENGYLYIIMPIKQ